MLPVSLGFLPPCGLFPKALGGPLEQAGQLQAALKGHPGTFPPNVPPSLLAHIEDRPGW